MIENRLLHFNTRLAFDNVKNNIAPSSIAFIDEGLTIYTHGVEYKCGSSSESETDLTQFVTYSYLSLILGRYALTSTIDQLVRTTLDAMTPSWNTIVQKIQTLEGNDSAIQNAIAQITAKVDGWESQISLETLWEGLTDEEWRRHVAQIFMWANEAGSGITLNADHINLNGDTSALRLFILNTIGDLPDNDYGDLLSAIERLNQWKNSMGYLTNSGIVFENLDNDNYIEFTTDLGLYHKHPYTQESCYRLGNDGSGYLGLIPNTNGQHAIWWDSDGTIHFHRDITDQWGGGGGEGPGVGQYYDQAFTMTSTNTAPAVPSDSNAHPWPEGADTNIRIRNNYDNPLSHEGNWARSVYDASTYGLTDTDDKYVWMATRLYDTNQQPLLSNWNGPWLISGSDGNPGADGDGIEFVYTRTANNNPNVVSDISAQLQSKVTNNGKSFQDNDFVPVGWNDSPSGVTSTYEYEWMGVRTSHYDENLKTSVWSDFSGPFLWSHYGQNGIDGDGIEYIYWASPNGLTPGLDDPSLWDPDDDTVGKNGKSFLQSDYVGPTNSAWEDNPIDISGQGYGQGSVEYVSTRKWNGTTRKWEAFTSPALWSNYARDGVANGYIIDLSNEVMPVVVSEEGAVNSNGWSSSTEVSVFHNGVSEFATVTAGTITRSDGGSTSGITATVATSSIKATDSTVTVSMANTVTGIAGVNIYIPLNITLLDESTRSAVITCFGVAAGEGKNGMSINLLTDASVLHRNAAGTSVDPTNIEVSLAVTEVDENNKAVVTKYTALNASECPLNGTLTFLYQYDNGSFVTLNSNKILNIEANHDSLTVRALLNGTPIDSERIPYVRDGQLGIPGTGAETYQIVPKYSTLKIGDDDKINGILAFKVFRQVGGYPRVEITSLPYKEDASAVAKDVNVYINGTLRLIAYNSLEGCWRCIVLDNDYDSTKSASAQINIVTATDMLLHSIIVPIPIKGETGNTGKSGKLTAFAFKRSVESPNPPTGGTYLNPTPDGWEDGIPALTKTVKGAVWETTNTFYADDSNTGWTTPVLIASVTNYEVMFSTVETNPGTPSTASRNWKRYDDILEVDRPKIIWRAEREVKDGNYGEWRVIKIKGETGKQGPQGPTTVQGLEGIVMRLSNYDPVNNANTTYYNGDVADEHGIRYKDVVWYNNAYWTPTVAIVSGQIPSTASQYWSMFNMVSDSYINNLIVNNAYIHDLTSKQIVVTKTVTQNGQLKEQVVAGMISGDAIPTEMINSDSTIGYTVTPNDHDAESVRIFAGSIPTSGNVKDTNFTVTEAGTVKICPDGTTAAIFNQGKEGQFSTGNAKIILNYDGSGQVANGAIKWDADGNFWIDSDKGGFINSEGTRLALNVLLNNSSYVYSGKIVSNTIPDALPASAFNGTANSSPRLLTYTTRLDYSYLFVKGGVFRSLFGFSFFLYDLHVLNSIAEITGWNYHSIPMAMLIALNHHWDSMSFGNLTGGKTLIETLGVNSVLISIPIFAYSGTSLTYMHSHLMHLNLDISNFGNYTMSTAILQDITNLPDVEILYSQQETRPSNPTSSNIGYNMTWNRDLGQIPVWCAYRYKDTGDWTSWTIENIEETYNNDVGNS